MITLADFQAQRKTVAVVIGKRAVNVTYRLMGNLTPYTPFLLPYFGLRSCIAMVVIEWDLSGKPEPPGKAKLTGEITAELASVPDEVLQAVWEGVCADLGPAPELRQAQRQSGRRGPVVLQ